MSNYQQITEELTLLTQSVANYIATQALTFSSDKIEHKGLNDLVSYVDKTAEMQLVKGLQQILPEAGFITEENLDILISEKIYLNNYIPAHLRYTNIESCILIQQNQFVDAYTTLGYLETVTPQSLEIVKLKLDIISNELILSILFLFCILHLHRSHKFSSFSFFKNFERFILLLLLSLSFEFPFSKKVGLFIL